MQAYQEPGLPFKKIYSGKVRDLYEVDRQTWLIVATDRISAFDFILPTPIPGKGCVLNQLSAFWFRRLKPIMDNHVIEDRFEYFPEALKKFSCLSARSMLVRPAEKFPVECVVRGYLAGSGWKEYLSTGRICGVDLPPGLKLSERLPQPVFTPATKEEQGQHDQNITFEQMVGIVGEATAGYLREKSLQLYQEACRYAESRGIIIADTKFEFGRLENRIILIDEIFTPDSSRFWEKEKYQPGQPQDSLDKQYIRDYLEAISWNKQPPAPPLPEEVVRKTCEKYNQIYELLVGQPL
ncbi:MAG TPA: phosphoribosylaminoimidazolesuccinocarboxamide synthase [bacterium]|nr:phosphoribosylaminoimidazolesuccinocarboxamide synthase [bacterium]HOL66851.1 phosphoribosylaminoimidazolesuccinocarboxamide synthase [bacterium]